MVKTERFRFVHVKKERPTKGSDNFYKPDTTSENQSGSLMHLLLHLLCIYCASTVHLLYKRGISRNVQIWSQNGTRHGTT